MCGCVYENAFVHTMHKEGGNKWRICITACMREREEEGGKREGRGGERECARARACVTHDRSAIYYPVLLCLV